MMVERYRFHRRAITAFNQLAKDEREQVLQTLAVLVDRPADEWTQTQARKLQGDQSLYLVRVNDSLRIILRAADGQEPEVMDFVRHETLEAFTKAAGKNGR
jgi:mRNA-degrading endonuclease RelE of RelBE toxin-antitoxin system